VLSIHRRADEHSEYVQLVSLWVQNAFMTTDFFWFKTLSVRSGAARARVRADLSDPGESPPNSLCRRESDEVQGDIKGMKAAHLLFGTLRWRNSDQQTCHCRWALTPLRCSEDSLIQTNQISLYCSKFPARGAYSKVSRGPYSCTVRETAPTSSVAVASASTRP
jgi:hypothetical protein